jgi:hypothetical protein
MLDLTPIWVVFGLGLLITVIEKLFGKTGNETFAYFTGLVGLIIGFGVVLFVLQNLFGEITTSFFNM